MLLLALALHLLYQVTRIYNLALGAVGAAVSYVLYLSFVEGGISAGFSVLIALVVALLVGPLLFFLMEPFTKRNDYLSGLLATFAVAVLIEATIAIIFGTGGKTFIQGILPVYEIGVYRIPVSGFATLALGLLAAGGGWFFPAIRQVGGCSAPLPRTPSRHRVLASTIAK